MSAPTPAPRTLLGEPKKPIPAPRTMVPVRVEQKGSPSENEGRNTLSRMGRSLSNASRQFAGDIGDKVQEGKKAVIQTTRQSVRKITRRFTTNFSESEQTPDNHKQKYSDSCSDIDLFSSIRFNSPIHLKDTENIYNNIDSEHSANDDDDQPPPPYPPPPLREEVYDKPQSIASGSTTSSEGPVPLQRTRCDYESVFPAYPYNSDSESCVDMTAGTIERNVNVSRSQSWNFYDPLPNREAVYNNIDSTPVMESQSERSFIRNNSIYENHSIISAPASSRPTQSVLMEFDPLTNAKPPNLEVDDLNELEKILQGDLYGNIPLDSVSTYDDTSDSDDVYISPPPPPARFDSLTAESSPPKEPPIQPVLTPIEEKSKSNWFTGTDASHQTTKPTEGKKGWLRQVNEVLKRAPELIKSSRNKENFVQRPTLMPKGLIQQKGMLYKITSGPVEDLFGEFSSRWCVLQPGLLLCHTDNTCDSVKEQFTMDSVMSIQLLQDQKLKYKCENDELYCFELNIAGKSRGGHIYGSKSISERRVWLQKIAESLTYRFGAQITSNYTRFGWGYIKEGLSGQWMGAWLVLTKRKLMYAVDNCTVKLLDLRKARCFKLEPVQEAEQYPCTTDKGPNLVIHFTSGTLYFRMWTQRETKVWCHVVKSAAHNNGAKLDHQQLTKNDIPVIVEKCVNFVYAYGSMAEGIYRRSGSNGVVSELLGLFRQDAWAVQLTDKYSNHDVANALKRFFRDLAEPLIDNNKRQYLFQVSLISSREEKVRMYKAIFDQLPTIVYNTTRRLLGHLYFISTQSDKNLMNIENLSSIWGPTLLQHEDEKDCSKDHAIVSQLIELYKYIFPEDAKEAEQEQKMLSVLERCSLSPQGAVNVKSSGDFHVWVYLYNKEGRTFNLLIGPNKTVYEILCELSPKVKIPVHELVLEECVLNNNLVRPIHHTEKLLDVVLKWGYWDDNDRKDNCVILNNISKYWEYINENTLPLLAELKFADNKTKNFKLYTFEFLQAKLSYTKDKSMSVKQSWNIEDVCWYFGHESKRSPSSKYTITFLQKGEHPKRTKSSPWFGNVVCWTEPALRALWLAAMWRAEHPNDLTPPPQHVNLMP